MLAAAAFFATPAGDARCEGAGAATDDEYVAIAAARDGAFGIGIDASATKAIAAAKSRCEDSAREASNCGSHLTVTRGSWTLAHRCGDQPLIVTSAYLDEAEQLMLNSEIEQQLHFDNAAQCRHLVTVDPAGNVTRRHGLPTPSGAALPKR